MGRLLTRRESLGLLLIILTFIISVSRPNVFMATDTVQITGRVRDTEGRAIEGVNVGFWSLTAPWILYGDVSTDASGRYAIALNRPKRLEAPAAYKGRPVYEGFELQVSSFTREWMTISCKVNTENRNIIERDFTLQPAAVMKIRAYSPNGTRIEKFSGDQLSEDRTWPVYTTDFQWKVTQSHFKAALAMMEVDLNRPNVINFPWDVSGFGKVILRADNGGKGFTLTRPGEIMTINLNYELTRTEHRLLRESYEKYLSEGYKLSKDLFADIQSAYEFLQKAESITDDVQRAHLADLCLNRTLWTAESLELERAHQDIEKYRKGNVILSIVGENGAPVRGADVAASQRTHDFMFGVLCEGAFDGRAYELLTGAGMNYVLLGFYWFSTEPSLGRYRLDFHPASEIVHLKKLGIRVSGEGLIGLEPGPAIYDTGLLNLSFEQLRDKIYEHVHRLVSTHSGYIDYWTVVHNPFSEEHILGFVGEQRVDLIKTGVAAIKKADPRARIHVYVDNICGLMTAGQLGRDYTHSVDPYTYLSRLGEYGIDHDGISLCLIYGSVDEYPPGQYPPGYAQPFRDIASISRILDWYSTLRESIHIDEFNVPGNFRSNLGYWHRRSWDEELKVEWMKKFYTIAFSKSLIRGITYRTAKDQPYQTAQRGLLSASYVPRESFYALKKLITEDWTTRLHMRTDANGRVEFRGFAGDYQITVNTEDSKINSTIHVYEGKSNAYNINLGRAKAELAITQAKEAVEKAKTEGRTILLNRAENLLEEAGTALVREDYAQAMLLANGASSAAGNAVTWLLIPAIIGATATALCCGSFILRRRILARRRRHT